LPLIRSWQVVGMTGWILYNERRPGQTETPGPSQAGNRCRILSVSQRSCMLGCGYDGWAGIGACHDAGLSCPLLLRSFGGQGYMPIWSVFPEGLEFVLEYAWYRDLSAGLWNLQLGLLVASTVKRAEPHWPALQLPPRRVCSRPSVFHAFHAL
jgi:hypothetical protein